MLFTTSILPRYDSSLSLYALQVAKWWVAHEEEKPIKRTFTPNVAKQLL